MSGRLRFVVTVDDAGLGQPFDAEELSIRFFDKERVRASFFVIPETPEGRGLAEDPEWLSRARTYEAHGYDYQLHGFRHEGFEFGPPEPWMVRVCGPDAIRAEEEGFTGMRHLWTDVALRERLLRALAAFERAFARRPEVFRAGCLAAGRDAFRILGEIGLRFDSNKIVNPRAWDLIAQDFGSTRPWDPAVPPVPYTLNDSVVELPCIGEYAWTLSDETMHWFTDTAEDDMDRVHAAGGLFILMCHQQRVGGADDLPRHVLRHIFRYARERHDAEFLTLRQLVSLVEGGAIPVRAAGDPPRVQ